MPGPTFFIVAGEASGDLHGANLIKAIKKTHPMSRFVGHGGDNMKSAGLEIMRHTSELAIMGFSEVIKHLPLMLNVMGESLGELRKLKPDRIILIDYPGFNLRLAKNCHGLQIPITYFILPQLWAWKEKRIKYFLRYIDQSLSIFPFEPDWFEARGVKTQYVGHPFSEISAPKTLKENFYKKHKLKSTDNILLLLPGSRQQEVERHLPVYLRVAKQIELAKEGVRTMIGKAPHVEIKNYGQKILVEEENIRDAITYSMAAITTSGTASLECAALDTPEVVCYKMSSVSGTIARHLNRSPYICMANLIAGKKIVPELLQGQVTAERIYREIFPLMGHTKERSETLEGFSLVRRALGLPGVYDRAAEAVLKRTVHG